MNGRKTPRRLAGVMTALIGVLCALVMAALFYGTMIYQLAGEKKMEAGARAQATPAPLVQGERASALFPGALLALNEQETGTTAQDVRMGGQTCRVVTRSYTLADGSTARALSATPAAYLERLSAEGVQMQLITGFVVAGMDAVYALENGTAVLAARDGDFVYLIEAETNEQALYALGAAASLE